MSKEDCKHDEDARYGESMARRDGNRPADDEFTAWIKDVQRQAEKAAAERDPGSRSGRR